MNKKKQLAKNTLIIFLGKVCTQLISFFLIPLYTAYLATDEYGIVDLVQTYVTLLVPIITMELEMSIFRYLVDSRTDSKNTKKLISNNFYILRFCLSLFIILYLLVICFIDIPFKWIILVDIIVCVLSGNFLQVARGMGKITDFSISCILTGLTTVISNIILICFVGLKSEGMIISMALANGLCSLYLFIKLKLYKNIDFKLVDKKLIKDMYKYSLPLVPNGISWWIVNISDRTIISFVLGAGANGLYAISNKFPTIISSLSGVFNLSWSESAALHINSEDRDEFFTDITNTVIKLFTALGIGMLACMPFVFPIMVNKQYADAYNYIPFLVIATVFNVVICLYSQVYLAKKLSKQVATTAILGAIINILVNVVFIKSIGIYAAALSTTISYFVMMVYRHFDLKKYINIKIETSLIIKSIIMFSITLFVYYYNNMWLNIINLIVVVIYCVLLNKVFLLSTYKTVMNKLKRS
ncbi:MAG: oligosaccharide flippase family protein [Bacilli bacterium]|nr:oligosaccharide flippase family protein [Bacilli bacterium]